MSLDLVTRLFLDTENYDKNLEKSKKNLTSFENQCKTYGNTISNFAPKIGNLISVAGKLSPAFVAAGVGMGVFNSKMKTSESFADSFNSALKQSEAGLSELQRRIFSLDFGNLISGFEDASNQAKRLYNAVDNLGTLKLFSGPGHKENLVNLQDAANRYREAGTKGDTKGMTSAKKVLMFQDYLRHYIQHSAKCYLHHLKKFQTELKEIWLIIRYPSSQAINMLQIF